MLLNVHSAVLTALCPLLVCHGTRHSWCSEWPMTSSFLGQITRWSNVDSQLPFMVLSYVDRCGHLSVPIDNPDPVLFVVNGAYRCHSFIFFSLFFSPNALPPRNSIRMTDFHVGLSLAQNFCSYFHFFRRAWFPVSGFPLPPFFFPF